MEKQKIKIAFIASTLKVGGAEKQWCELVKQIDKNQFEIVLFELLPKNLYVNSWR